MAKTESMVERVTKGTLGEMRYYGFDASYEQAASVARTAIAAMYSEPSRAAQLAAWDLLEANARVGNLEPGRIRGSGMPHAIWNVMIRAALEEPMPSHTSPASP